MTENNDFNNIENDSTNSRNEKRFELCEINCFEYGIEVFNEIMDNGTPLSQKQVCELLNELHEENTMLKGHIRELYRLVKFDVDNGIEVYPKVLLEYIVNILKIIGDVE